MESNRSVVATSVLSWKSMGVKASVAHSSKMEKSYFWKHKTDWYESQKGQKSGLWPHWEPPHTLQHAHACTHTCVRTHTQTLHLGTGLSGNEFLKPLLTDVESRLSKWDKSRKPEPHAADQWQSNKHLCRCRKLERGWKDSEGQGEAVSVGNNYGTVCKRSFRKTSSWHPKTTTSAALIPYRKRLALWEISWISKGPLTEKRFLVAWASGGRNKNLARTVSTEGFSYAIALISANNMWQHAHVADKKWIQKIAFWFCCKDDFFFFF